MPCSCFSRRARGDDLKFGKGGLLKGPAILPFEMLFCSLLVTISGCVKADWELLEVKEVSLPSKFKYTPDVNMSTICLRCGYPVSHLLSAWVLTGVGKRVRQFCSIVLNLCLVLWGNALSVHRMIAFAAGANVLVLAVFCCTADTLGVVAETVAGRWTALLPSCVSLERLRCLAKGLVVACHCVCGFQCCSQLQIDTDRCPGTMAVFPVDSELAIIVSPICP